MTQKRKESERETNERDVISIDKLIRICYHHSSNLEGEISVLINEHLFDLFHIQKHTTSINTLCCVCMFFDRDSFIIKYHLTIKYQSIDYTNYPEGILFEL